jgi:HK97 family phage prohead protease
MSTRYPPDWFDPEVVLERFEAERILARWKAEQLQAPIVQLPATIRELALTIKSVNEQREIEGIASASSPDTLGDIVEPLGAQYELPLPLLWGHDSRSPVGEVHDVVISKDMLRIKARIAEVSEPGVVKELVDRCWHNVKYRLVKGLSIGFRPIESVPTKTGFRYSRWSLHEVSLVAIPAHSGAKIEAIR